MSLPPPQGTATCDKRGAPAAGDRSAADHAEPLKWEGVLELLDTIPGVGCITAASIIANSAEPIGSVFSTCGFFVVADITSSRRRTGDLPVP